MTPNVAASWNKALSESAEWRHRQVLFMKEQQRRKEEIADKLDDSLDLVSMVVLASESDIAELEAQLTTYDTAVINALDENRIELDAVNARVDDMLDRAYVIEDGRRVFKTRDGHQVFDEEGEELDDGVIEPDAIPDFHPRWEDFKPDLALSHKLQTERDELHAYQRKLDGARERLDDQGLTKADLDDLKDDLEIEMPDAVKRHLPGYEELQTPDLAGAFSRAAAPAVTATMPENRFDALSL